MRGLAQLSRRADRAARRNAPRKDVQRQGVWMVTFSDLSTLLLALFVLLFSMSSIDSGLIERISSTLRDESPWEIPGWGRMDSRLEMVLELLKDSQRLRENEKVIKDLLFPDDVLPPELDKGMIRGNIAVRSREGGVGIVFSEDLLFSPGSAAIPRENRKLLHALTPLLKAAPYDILISGHSDDELFQGEGMAAQLQARYQLSTARALAVLGLYAADGVDRSRLSGAGYGPDKPLEVSGQGRDAGAENIGNRRVEVIIKSSGTTANYY